MVLFDEIEKAHPDVLNILLQILDDGEVTDAHGRKVNFENTVIVMTSNAGSGKAAGAVGFGRSADDQDKERVMKALQEFLRPEFINRVDEIVYFHQLTEENFRGIAGIMLEELKAALEEKGYTFESAEIEMVPQNYIVMTSEDDVRSMTKLLDMLEDNEDVQNVWHNWQQD